MISELVTQVRTGHLAAAAAADTTLAAHRLRTSFVSMHHNIQLLLHPTSTTSHVASRQQVLSVINNRGIYWTRLLHSVTT